jgi:hypothetical protein
MREREGWFPGSENDAMAHTEPREGRPSGVWTRAELTRSCRGWCGCGCGCYCCVSEGTDAGGGRAYGAAAAEVAVLEGGEAGGAHRSSETRSGAGRQAQLSATLACCAPPCGVSSVSHFGDLDWLCF